MVVVTLLIYQINKSMKEYFKPRARFKQKEHPFDIGMAFSWWKGHYDRHFLNSFMSAVKTSLMLSTAIT